LISFGVVCFAGRDIGKGLSRNLAAMLSRCADSELTLKCGINIFERWTPKSSALNKDIKSDLIRNNTDKTYKKVKKLHYTLTTTSNVVKTKRKHLN